MQLSIPCKQATKFLHEVAAGRGQEDGRILTLLSLVVAART